MVKEQQEAWKERQTKLGNITHFRSSVQSPGCGSMGAGQTSQKHYAKKSNPTSRSKSLDHRTKRANFRDSRKTEEDKPISVYPLVLR